jgi:hypothetical protein
MDETNLVPEIFFTLMNQADKLEELDDATLWRYYSLIDNDPSFIPELVAIVGPDIFAMLVHNFGGQKITIPTADQILSFVRKHEEAGD